MALGPRRRAADDARYHNELRRKVLEAHPEAGNLIGPDWRTALFAALMLALHWTIAWGVSLTSWWVAFLAAFVFGQTIYHSVSVLIHENAHRLVFRNAKARFAYDVLTEMLVTSFGYQLIYQHNHVTSHHAYLGDYDRDYEHEDAYYVAARTRYRAANPIRYRMMTIGIMLFHLLPFAFFTDPLIVQPMLGKATGLPPRDKTRKSPATRPSRGELYALALVSLIVNIGLFMVFGFLGWLYHVWSMSMLSGRWGASLRGQVLSEHYGEDAAHPTRSTYWWGNRIFYNIGYHVEHHTLSSVPWMKLPKLRAIAPEVFNLGNELNYYGFWWKQVKSDFTLPRRVSANDAESIVRRRPVQTPANKADEEQPAASVAA
jgi:sphingolipid delta-4 desaturase